MMSVVVLHRDVGEHRAVADAGHVQDGVDPAELVDRGARSGVDVGFLA